MLTEQKQRRRQKNQEAQARWIAKQRSLGLCIVCGKSHARSTLRCHACTEDIAAKGRERRKKHKLFSIK